LEIIFGSDLRQSFQDQPPFPLYLKRLKVYPLAERRSESRLEEILVEPAQAPRPCPATVISAIHACAQQSRRRLDRKASVMLIYGAHLIKNGGQLLLNQMMERGWLTHLATNGAGVIHDWSFLSVPVRRTRARQRRHRAPSNLDETGRYIHLALLAAGCGATVSAAPFGRFITKTARDAPCG